MTELQKRVLKGIIDELVVNKGTIKVKDPNRLVDGMRMEALVRLACKYYRMIYSGEDIPYPEGTWEWYRCANCEEKCAEFSRICSQEPHGGKVPEHCPRGGDYSPEFSCANCGRKFRETRRVEGFYIPFCPRCRSLIGEDVEILSELIT